MLGRRQQKIPMTDVSEKITLTNIILKKILAYIDKK